MTERLTNIDGIHATAERPGYDRSRLKTGILHIGPGAFFRAHVAALTEAAIPFSEGGWGIEVVSLRTAQVADDLNAQNGLYTVLTRDSVGTTARVVGGVRGAYVAPRDPERLLQRLEDEDIRIVSLTVTEKAYGLDPATGGLDERHEAIATDLVQRHAPTGVIGYLVEGLDRRRRKGVAPFTPLSCDNLPNNGVVLKRLVLDFASRVDPDLATWIGENVSFPSTMVDRITPASTEETYNDAARLTGYADHAAVETEPFAQWVIEDRFPGGRPAWENVPGVLMVADVAPYEKMKLRMLNGTHSLLAYLGYMRGHEFIRDVMDDPELVLIARRHMRAAATTLDGLPGFDVAAYAEQLIGRFSNKAIAHRTYQIAMDGSQKLPQRLLEPATDVLEHGRQGETYAIGVAAWMRYAMGTDQNGKAYDLRDPRSGEISRQLEGVELCAEAIAARLFALPGLFSRSLRENLPWRRLVYAHLERLMPHADR